MSTQKVNVVAISQNINRTRNQQFKLSRYTTERPQLLPLQWHSFVGQGSHWRPCPPAVPNMYTRVTVIKLRNDALWSEFSEIERLAFTCMLLAGFTHTKPFPMEGQQVCVIVQLNGDNLNLSMVPTDTLQIWWEQVRTELYHVNIWDALRTLT